MINISRYTTYTYLSDTDSQHSLDNSASRLTLFCSILVCGLSYPSMNRGGSMVETKL